MTTFTFDSEFFSQDGETCNRIEVGFWIPFRIGPDDDSPAEVEYIWDLTEERERDFMDFPKTERDLIQRAALRLGQNAPSITEKDVSDE